MRVHVLAVWYNRGRLIATGALRIYWPVNGGARKRRIYNAAGVKFRRACNNAPDPRVSMVSHTVIIFPKRIRAVVGPRRGEARRGRLCHYRRPQVIRQREIRLRATTTTRYYVYLYICVYCLFLIFNVDLGSVLFFFGFLLRIRRGKKGGVSKRAIVSLF